MILVVADFEYTSVPLFFRITRNKTTNKLKKMAVCISYNIDLLRDLSKHF